MAAYSARQQTGVVTSVLHHRPLGSDQVRIWIRIWIRLRSGCRPFWLLGVVRRRRWFARCLFGGCLFLGSGGARRLAPGSGSGCWFGSWVVGSVARLLAWSALALWLSARGSGAGAGSTPVPSEKLTRIPSLLRPRRWGSAPTRCLPVRCLGVLPGRR